MPLQLSFANLEVRHLCECRAAAEKALGNKAAKHLRARLADLCAAEKISDVVAGSLKPTARGTLRIALHPPYKLLLEPDMHALPKKDDGKTDWDAIECFRVVAVN